MFAIQGISAQCRGMEAAVGSPITSLASAAVADDAVKAFVWLKACMSSKGGLDVFDIVGVCAMLYVESL